MRSRARGGGVRSVLGVPLMRDGQPIGAIVVGRTAIQGRSPRGRSRLLQTFADQAVIAIENVRLFNGAGGAQPGADRSGGAADRDERDPARDQPVADRGPVRHDRRGRDEALRRQRGEHVHVRRSSCSTWRRSPWTTPKARRSLRRHFPRPPSRGMAASRAVLTRRVVAIHDTKADPEYEWATAEQWGFRSVLCIPLMREGTPIGAIAVGRPRPRAVSGQARSPCCRPSPIRP